MGRKKNGPKKEEKKEQNASSFGSPPPPYSHLPPPSSSRSFKMDALLQHHGRFSSSPLSPPFPSRGKTQLEHVSRNIYSWETCPTLSKKESTERTISHLTKTCYNGRPTDHLFLPPFPTLLALFSPTSCRIGGLGRRKEEGPPPKGGGPSDGSFPPHIGPTYPFFSPHLP